MNTYLETHAQFDQCGNPVNFWNERGVQSQKEYSSEHKHAYLTQTTSAVPDPSGQHGSNAAFTSTSTYDPVTGQVLTATDTNGQTTTFSYTDDQGNADPLNRLRKVTRPDGGWTKTNFNDVVGNLYIHTESKLDATRSTHAFQFFDKSGRGVRSFALESGLTYIVTDTEYDQMGRVKRVSNPFHTSIAGTGNPNSEPDYWVTAAQPAHWTSSTYDALGRVTQVTLPDGMSVQTTYQGVYTTVTDQAGKLRRQKTDALGHIVRVDEPDMNGDLGGINAPAQATYYDYDTLGNVIHITQGAGASTQHRYFKYDALSRLTHERQVEQAGTFALNDPLTGNSAWSRKLVYDETLGGESYKGLLTSATDARNIHTQFYYDRLNRTYQVTYSDGTPTVTRSSLINSTSAES